MSKKGNGEGSIYEHRRDGRKVGYRGSYTVHTAAGPKRRYVSGKTREDVRRKLAKAMADRDGGFVFDAGALTVGEHVAQWLQGSARGTVRESTFERYEQIVRLHIIPTLGRLKLKALTPRTCGTCTATASTPDSLQRRSTRCTRSCTRASRKR